MAFEVFGFSFGKQSDTRGDTGGFENKAQPSFVSPDSYDGTFVMESGGLLSSYFDFGGTLVEENSLVSQYRSMALYPEVDKAIQDVINESIVFDDKNQTCELNLDDVTDISDNIKAKISTEFKNIKKLLDFGNRGDDIFRRWYIDSKLFYHIIIDMNRPEKGILELRSIDPAKIKKVRKVEKEIKNVNGVNTPVVKKIEEYFVYMDIEESAILPTSTNGIKIALDSITYVHSGIVDSSTKRVVGYLQKAIRPLNMLRQIEDAVVIYRMSRAPERRIFYIDVGNLPKQKAEQYVNSLMNKYRNKITYDSKSGEIKDERNHMSMLEDFWIPRREGGKGTEITTLDGGQNLGQMEDVDYLLKKVYRALNVPISRLESSTGFNLGRSNEISRDEVQFFKFIEKLRKRFAYLFLDLLKKQCLLKGIMTADDWNRIYQDLRFVWNKDSYYTELKENEILREKVDMLNIIANFTGQFYSTKWVRKNILKQTDEEMAQIDSEMEEEKAALMQQQQQQMMAGIGPDGEPLNPQQPQQPQNTNNLGL
jgi:hypothetical protein